MSLIQSEPQTANSHPLSSGKMYRASYPAKTMPSAAFLQALPEKMSRCSYQGRNGQTRVMCLDHKELSPGECWTLNISEWPNDADVCLLSQVLETASVPPRYFLSQTACAGILNRAERRGKQLPAMLEAALLSVVTGTQG